MRLLNFVKLHNGFTLYFFKNKGENVTFLCLAALTGDCIKVVIVLYFSG